MQINWLRIFWYLGWPDSIWWYTSLNTNKYIFFETYNVVIMWPYHVILLVIISNNIPWSLPIRLIYYLVFNGLFFYYTKLYPFICWKSVFLLYIIEKCTSCYLIIRKRTHSSSYHFIYLLELAFTSFLPYPPYNYRVKCFIIAAGFLKSFSNQTFSWNYKSWVTNCMICWVQQIRYREKSTSKSMRRIYLCMSFVR